MAAGLATRMGKDKLALPWKNGTVLGYVIGTVLEVMKVHKDLYPQSGIEIHVIARKPVETYLSEEGVREFFKYGGVWNHSPRPRPLAETINMGLHDLNAEMHSVAFLPGDQVGVRVQDLSACLEEVLKYQPDFLVPMAGNTPGSPVFFHKRYIPELLALQGEQGGRMVLNRYPERWSKYTVEESLFLDVDTPEQYDALFNS